MCEHFYLHALFGFPMNTCQKYFFALDVRSSGCSQVNILFTSEEQIRRLAPDVDTDCWAQNSNVQSCFHDFQISSVNKQDELPSGKLQHVFVLFVLSFIDRAHDTSLVSLY